MDRSNLQHSSSYNDVVTHSSSCHCVPFKTFAFLLLSGLSCFAADQSQAAPNSAIVPADRLKQSWWADRHNAVLEAIRNHPDTQLLLIGDSITNNYDKAQLPDENFQPTWNKFYAPRNAMNLGFSGDTTANVLWRLDHGEVNGLKPKLAVVLIGTNDTGHGQTAEETEAGIDAVIGHLEQRLPETQILLLGILPSDISDDKTRRDQAVNQYLASGYGENRRVTYVDISSIFYANGKLNTSIFYDPRLPQHGKPLHPDTNGQRMMAEALEPSIARLMGDVPRAPLSSMTDIDTALIPSERLEQDSYDWYARHHAEIDLGKRLRPRLVLIGDSITHFWGGLPNSSPVNGPLAWQRAFGSMPVLNMGFGWDRTQNVLWRIRQGEFNDIHPQWVVLAIGTNNMTGTSHARSNTPEEVVEGIQEIVNELRQRSPESHIVLMAIFPRGAKPDSPQRAPIQKTNQLLAKRFAQDSSMTYLDIGERFLATDGSLPATLMPDGTHPSDAGYQLWANALIAEGIHP